MLFGRHIVELNATNNTLVRSYAWGPDLSVTMDGAGGVGGLAWVTLHTASGPASGAHFTCYDGNGNIVALVSSTTGDVTARYEYGPFGEPIRISGPAASLNPFRFSTKRTENNTDLVLYEYRAYNPSLGRWLSRDLKMERGDINLYCLVKNAPIETIDYLGLGIWAITSLDEYWTKYNNAGSKCCPACEIISLREQLTQQMIILNKYKSSVSDPGISVSNYKALATTRCDTFGAHVDFQEDITTCVGWCTVYHEAVHVEQCVKEYNKHQWIGTKRYAELSAELEIPAYEMSIKCLRALISLAVRNAEFYGSFSKACKCCLDDLKKINF